jgi:hypothetical protein
MVARLKKNTLSAKAASANLPRLKVVMVHPDWGLYLGTGNGVLLWTKIETGGLYTARAFPGVQHAKAYLSMMDMPTGRDGVRLIEYVPVVADIEGEWASTVSLRRAGLGPLIGDLELTLLARTPSVSRA